MNIAKRQWRNLFSSALNNLMTERGLTVRELAEKSNVPRRSIYRYLSATHTPDILTIENLARALHVNVDQLIEFGFDIDTHSTEYNSAEVSLNHF